MAAACRACDRITHSLNSQRYCPACDDNLREMVDDHDVKPLDGDSYDDAVNLNTVEA